MGGEEQVVYLIAGVDGSSLLNWYKMKVYWTNHIAANSYYEGTIGSRHHSMLTLGVL